MSALEQIVLAFQSLAHAIREIFRPSLWVPWLAVLAVQLLVIGSLWWFAHPAVSWLLAPVLERLAGESALRYPNIFQLMPELYARADVLIAILVGAIAGGASTTLFAAVFAGQPLLAGQGLRRALSRALPLVLANLPLSLLLLGFSFGLEWWLAERDGPALIARLAPILTIGLAVMLQALFLWVNPLLMLGRLSLIETLASLPRAASHGAWAALTMAAAASIPLLPVQMLAHGSNRIVSHGTPEMVGWLVVMQALIAIVTAFVLTGGSVLAYQSLVGPALEEEL
ncbi:MAG TPA: hypothetical protein VFQ05_10665 [Candidatus Eisenbacteria bacterium]|nr:hypothetical protein [Candidatus Eisenbacteria bacterium]